MKKDRGYKHIAFWGVVALSVIIIAYLGLGPISGEPGAPDTKSLSQGNNPQPNAQANPAPSQAQSPSDQLGKASENSPADKKADDKSTGNDNPAAIKTIKSQINSVASFFPYTVDGVNMEVIAVKASDGTIRTALNTCQVCYDSGRGYYIQEGDYLVCQNCGNRFHIDQVEKIKGGCNPIPVLAGDKTDQGDSIILSRDFLASQKSYFIRWKTR